MAEPMLYALDERRYNEQIRLMFAEAGIKYKETILSEKDQDQWREEGKLMFGKFPMLKWGDLDLCESKFWCVYL